MCNIDQGQDRMRRCLKRNDIVMNVFRLDCVIRALRRNWRQGTGIRAGSGTAEAGERAEIDDCLEDKGTSARYGKA